LRGRNKVGCIKDCHVSPHPNLPPLGGKGKKSLSKLIYKSITKCFLNFVLVVSLSLILLTISCKSADTPVPINSEVDMCEYCRMTIDDFHYAAEILEKRKVHKFDDIGCMMAYAQSKNLVRGKVYFWVTDFDSTSWIKGEEAHFVISPEIHTPMGYGIVAFKDFYKAKEISDKNRGQVIKFDSLFNIDWNPSHEH
jgi:copper chaperone NosL